MALNGPHVVQQPFTPVFAELSTKDESNCREYLRRRGSKRLQLMAASRDHYQTRTADVRANMLLLLRQFRVRLAASFIDCRFALTIDVP